MEIKCKVYKNNMMIIYERKFSSFIHKIMTSNNK